MVWRVFTVYIEKQPMGLFQSPFIFMHLKILTMESIKSLLILSNRLGMNLFNIFSKPFNLAKLAIEIKTLKIKAAKIK